MENEDDIYYDEFRDEMLENDEISAEDSINPEPLVSYAIFDKEKKIDKYIQKILKPLLSNVISDFKKKNNGKNLSEVSQFKDFKKTLDQIFGSDTQNVDQKLKGLFY